MLLLILSKQLKGPSNLDLVTSVFISSRFVAFYQRKLGCLGTFVMKPVKIGLLKSLYT